MLTGLTAEEVLIAHQREAIRTEFGEAGVQRYDEARLATAQPIEEPPDTEA